MTGAGTAEVALAREASYAGSLVDTPTWWSPGSNLTVTGPTFNREQRADRAPGDPRPQSHRPGNASGQLTLEFALAGTEHYWEDAVFHSGGADPTAGTSLPPQGGRAPSWHVYISSTLLDGTDVPRVGIGAVVTDCTITWTQGEDVTVELTIQYADEPDNPTAPASGDIVSPSPEDAYNFDGASINVGTTYQSELSTATLSLSNLARLRRGQSQIATNAVVGAIQPSFSTDATFTETDQLERALSGRSSAELINEVDASLQFDNAGGDTRTYTVVDARPDSADWSDLVGENDLSEAVDYRCTNVTTA